MRIFLAQKMALDVVRWGGVEGEIHLRRFNGEVDDFVRTEVFCTMG